MASVRRRNGKWQARIYGGPSRSFTLHKDALMWAREQERKKELGELYREAPESLGPFLDAHIARRKAALKERSGERMDMTAEKLRPLRHLPIPDVKLATVDDWLAGMGPSRTTELSLSLLKATLRSARARGQSVDEAVLEIRTPKYEKRESHFLTVEQLYELASWMPSYIRRIVLVAGLTGLRQGELLDLKDSDLDLDNGTLRVRKGKTQAAARTVHLGREVVTLLREQLLERAAGEYVWTQDGERFKRDSLNGYFRRARKHAGLEIDFHGLRRTYASLMIRAGVDVRTIAAEMGHKDGGGLLLKRYGHLYDDAGQVAAAKLDALVAQG